VKVCYEANNVTEPIRLLASCEMTLETQAPTPMIAMLRPRSGQAQWIVREAYELSPSVPVTEYVDVFGNLCQRIVIPKGKFQIQVSAEVMTDPNIAVKPGASLTPVDELPESALQYLLPSRYCPSDQVKDRAGDIVGEAKPGYDQVEAIRAFIQKNLRYRYGASDGSTTALDTLRDGAGVCRDFAHVGITLCRRLHIPARMVVGYLHELDPMDMHAWFEAFVDGRWYTFDATQEKPRGGRIIVAYGRDAADVALFTEYGDVTLKKMTVAVRKATQ
jgi:transglutaminase-like putative cysteine protease